MEGGQAVQDVEQAENDIRSELCVIVINYIYIYI